jgi:hypothetical protein
MPKLQMKGRPGARQIRIGDGAWLPIDQYIQPAKLPDWVRSVALYLNGPDSDVRLTVLRAIAKEQRWEITGEFVDQGDGLGQAYRAFSEHDHGLKNDALIFWTANRLGAGCLPPKITPNLHKLPREEWPKYY